MVSALRNIGAAIAGLFIWYVLLLAMGAAIKFYFGDDALAGIGTLVLVGTISIMAGIITSMLAGDAPAVFLLAFFLFILFILLEALAAGLGFGMNKTPIPFSALAAIEIGLLIGAWVWAFIDEKRRR